MRPKSLKISGLNSFVEEQTIDFSTLIESGLFGIFGPTGSGKSTILDAITIALYGYNAIARGTKQFINTDLNKVYLGYEFDSGDNTGRKTYRIERSIKKNKHGGIKTDFARLSFLDGEGNILKIVDKVSEINNEIEKIIGLNHQDFTRSVVLPQGKFSEFLKLSGSDRRNMLERILSLEKYGGNLVDRIRSYKRKREEELQVLNGELSRFEGITEENIKTLKSELFEIQNNENELKNEIAFIEKRYEELSKVWRLQTELNKYLEIKGKLDSQTCEIENLRNTWEKGNNARNVKPYLDRYNDTLEDINKNKRILKGVLIDISDIKKKLEVTELKYNEAYRKKDCELPILIEKETNVKNAIELKEETQRLNNERNELAAKFTQYSETMKKSEEELNKLKTNIGKNNNEIEELENKSKLLKISQEYREKLTTAWELKNRLNELRKDEKVSLKNIESLNKNVLASEKVLGKNRKELEEKEIGYTELKNELENLQSNPPRDNEYILKQEIELHTLRSVLEETKENLKKKNDLEGVLKEIHNSKRETQIKIDYLKNRFIKNNEKLENVKKEIKELEKVHRAALLSLHLKDGKPCPVCGSFNHPNIAESIDEGTLNKVVKIKDGFEEYKKELEMDIHKLEIEIKRDIGEENKLKDELIIYEKKLKNHDIDKLEHEIINKAEKTKNLKISLKDWEEKSNKLKKLSEVIEKEKISLEKESIRFIEGIKKDTERLDEENVRKEGLSKKINKANELYNKARVELSIENIDHTMEKVRKNQKELERLEEKLKELRNNVKKFDVQREKLEEKLNETRLKRSRIEEAGKEKRGVLDEYNEKIKKIVGEREPKSYLKEIQENKTRLVIEEESLRKTNEEEKNLLSKLREKRAGLENTNKILEDSIVNIEHDLKEALKENKFDNINEVNTNLIPNQKLKSIEEEIKKFDDENKLVGDNIDRIKNDLKGASLVEDEFSKFKEDMENKKKAYRFVLEEIGKKKERISEMEKNFKRVKEINEKVKKLQHLTDMLSEMFKLVSGNRFVEYVATSHLRYIAKEASKRLMDITNKRYNLELDSKGNFIICDNYNGGVRRDCNTLSGGETFLTSLALALSLSSQIQLKGNASIEFFFLDEGFGTLDNQLLDTVMTSLERLHQEKLAVGIISHVNELKNRVPIKLVVTPSESGLHGTKVAIERN